jgi:amino acid adenylation domain-containing protein
MEKFLENSPAYDHLSFNRLIDYAWQYSAFYRELYMKHGIREQDLPHLEIQDLPLVTKETLMGAFDEVVTDPRLRKEDISRWLEDNFDPHKKYLDEFIVVHSSGGSSTVGITAYDQKSWLTMTSAAAPLLWPSKKDDSSRYRNAFYFGRNGHFATATSAALISSRLAQTMTFSMFEPMEDILARLTSFQPERVSSYASGVAFLAGLTLEGKLPISPREVVISGDRLTPGMEALISEAWRAKIYDIYAAIESLYLAIKLPDDKDWTVFDELNILECLDAENKHVPPGGHGRAVITNLYNYTTPYIRYELTDYVVPGQPRNGHPTLRSILGKSFDALPVLKNDDQPGRIPSYDLAGFYVPGIDLIQFVSCRPEYLEIEYCGRNNIDEKIEHAFREFLSLRGAARTGFQVKRVEHIWNSKKGSKLKLIRHPGDELIVLQTPISPPMLQSPVRLVNPFVPFAENLVETSIPQCFEDQVARHPDSVAIKDASGSITYQELNYAANRVAHVLQDLSIGPSHPVALLFGHKAAMVVAMLGVLKAGGFYVPLDPSFPPKRTTAILEEAQAEIILTDTEQLLTAQACKNHKSTIINLDELNLDAEGTDLKLPIRLEAPACLLFTSGSTGKPKGVLLDQRAILHRVMLYTNDYHVCKDDRLSLLQLYVYSASVRDIYGALLNGAGLFIYDLKKLGIHYLAEWLTTEGITVFYCVPTIFRAFMEVLDREAFVKVRLVRLGGEQVLPRDVEGYRRHFKPDCILANALASTEAGTICQYFMNHQSRIMVDTVPVGYPVRGKEILLLDDNGNPVEDGAIGEIVVSSKYLGPGYWMEDETTRKDMPATMRIFHTMDLGFRLPDGQISLVGRKDWTIKIRGQRINVAEIEEQLVRVDNIQQAVVVGHTNPEGTVFLAAYIQPGSKPEPSTESIRRSLGVFLPEFMIPSVFIFLDSLPLTPGGKIDRQALPYPIPIQKNSVTGGTPPRTPFEEVLYDMWKEILVLDQFSVEDSFFDLGGDSLRVVELTILIEKEFGQRIPVNALIRHNTIARLAELLSPDDIPQPANTLVTLQPMGEKPPLFLIPGLGTGLLYFHDLVTIMGADRPVIGLQDFVKINNPEAITTVDTVEKRASAYLKEIRTAYPHGPYYLAGHSFGGFIALEIGRLLIGLGEDVPLLALLDTLPPGPKQKASMARRFLIHWENLRTRENLWAVFDYFSDRLKRIISRLMKSRSARWLIERFNITIQNEETAARLAATWYHPSPYPGDVVLFKVRQRPLYITWDPMSAWPEFIKGDLQIREVPGNHINALKEPHVRDLVRQLKECLDEVDS